MKRTIHYLAITLAILTAPRSWCQEIKPVTLTKYTQNQGLSSYYVTKIVQDSYGFLWIGTQEGLNVFDGTGFIIFSKQSDKKHRLGGSFVSDIAEDKKRELVWVLTTYGDICGIDINTRIVKKRIDKDPHNKPLADKWIRCLYVQGDTLWMGGLDVISAYNIQEDRYLKLDIEQKSGIGQGEYNISKLVFDPQGRMWLGSEGYGIVVLDKNFNRIKSFREELKNNRKQNRKLLFWDMIIQRNVLCVGTSWGLRIFSLGDKAIEPSSPKNIHNIPATSEIQSLAFASENLLLFSTPGGFYTYDLATGNMLTYQDENIEEDWLASTFQIFYDTLSQKTWVGTQDGLASFYIRDVPFISISKSRYSNTKLKHLYALLPLSGKEALGGDENGLFHINTETRKIIQIDTSSANLVLFKDAASNIFVSNKNGLQILRNKRMKAAHEIFPALTSLKDDHLSCAIQYNDSIVLFASIIQKGLSVWNTRSGELKTFHNDSVKNKIEGLSIINYLFKNADNRVFILTEKSIVDFNPITGAYSTKILQTDSSGVINNFMDMSETQSDYWIATYGNGLINTDRNFNVKRILTIDSGLNNNCVYRVFTHDNRLVIASTNNGLSVVDLKTRNIKKYFQPDGLHANGFEQLCGYQFENRIYVGGVNGFTIIEPALFTSNPVAPTLYLHNVKIETPRGTIDSSHLKMDHVIIPNDVLQTTILFSALNYSNPSGVKYAYQIDELSDDWVSLENQNFVNLIGLNAGTYSLRIKASNEDGVWSQPVILRLVYLPKWYQTGGFKIVVFLSCLAMIYSFFRYRLSHIKKQQLIRKEIANDLHDDIGSTLNTLKIFTHLAKKEPFNLEHLDHIEESITNASIGLRDMIWVLDDSLDTVFELMERIKKFTLPVCDANNIQFISFVVSDSAKPISKTEKRNLLLIAKESINNSIKYACCEKIRVSLIQKKNKIQLIIEDDGKGFDLPHVVHGNGLLNIKYRAKQIAYFLDINSAAHTGTRIELKNDS